MVVVDSSGESLWKMQNSGVSFWFSLFFFCVFYPSNTMSQYNDSFVSFSYPYQFWELILVGPYAQPYVYSKWYHFLKLNKNHSNDNNIYISLFLVIDSIAADDYLFSNIDLSYHADRLSCIKIVISNFFVEFFAIFNLPSLILCEATDLFFLCTFAILFLHSEIFWRSHEHHWESKSV